MYLQQIKRCHIFYAQQRKSGIADRPRTAYRHDTSFISMPFQENVDSLPSTNCYITRSLSYSRYWLLRPMWSVWKVINVDGNVTVRLPLGWVLLCPILVNDATGVRFNVARPGHYLPLQVTTLWMAFHYRFALDQNACQKDSDSSCINKATAMECWKHNSFHFIGTIIGSHAGITDQIKTSMEYVLRRPRSRHVKALLMNRAVW